jgi:hypothetical protein
MASGDDVDLVVIVRASDRCTRVDVTGTTPLWVLSDGPGCRPRVSKTGAITDAANGEITVSLVPGDTERLCGSYHHELQLTDGSSRISTVMVGKAKITADSAP